MDFDMRLTTLKSVPTTYMMMGKSASLYLNFVLCNRNNKRTYFKVIIRIIFVEHSDKSLAHSTHDVNIC